jgi:ribonuclease R
MNKTKIFKEGVVSAHPKGFGFLNVSDTEDFFIPPPLMRKTVPGDRVRCTIDESPKKPGQLQAIDLLVLERPVTTWQGTLAIQAGAVRLLPDEPCFMPIEVTNVPPGIAADCVVSVRSQSSDSKAPVLKVSLERQLGVRTRKGFDQDYALARFDFPDKFSAETLAEAQLIEQSVSATDLQQRTDLRDVPFVTIDGEYTRDFDDAVFARPLADGSRVMVAIADVSYFVKRDSALDKAARASATSVYLPGKTMPMLPEELSNGVCSLVPGVDRLAVVADLELDERGIVRKAGFYRAVIRSAARLTYNQVQVWMDGDASAVTSTLVQSLSALRVVFESLLEARKVRGHMEFEDKEPKLIEREDGQFNLVFEERTEAHKLVEELMLLANHAVARHLQDKLPETLFRHQALPDADDWFELLEWAAARGMDLTGDAPTLRKLADFVEQAQANNQGLKAALRVRGIMQSATYDREYSAHFSLGYTAYTHFTSPIRRYADLLVHRILVGEEVGEDLAELAERCSVRAKDSRMAERHVWDRLKKRILARDVTTTEPLKAHVVHGSKRGLRVVISDWQCAAFIPAEVLESQGCSYNIDTEVWTDGAIWEPGHELFVRWNALDESDGRTELYAIPMKAESIGLSMH